MNSRTAFALTAGLVRLQVYLSSRLLSELSTAELAIVVHHEQTHCRAATPFDCLGPFSCPVYICR